MTRVVCSSQELEYVEIDQKGRNTTLKADMLFVAAGSINNIDLLPKHLRTQDDKIEVNQFMQTANPDIYAGGDIARFYNPYIDYCSSMRRWSMARDMGRLAALNMLGLGHGYGFVPFYWTDMFGSA